MKFFEKSKNRSRRFFIWLYAKIQRDTGTPEFIARGWAIGVFFGTFIPFGAQLILSIPTAFLLKGSKIGATIGTLITNPLTIWVIYPLQCYAGVKLLGIFTGTDYSYEHIQGLVGKVIQSNGAGDAYRTLFGMGAELAVGFFIGGAILSILTVPPTYFTVKSMVIRYRAKRDAGKSKKP